MKVKNGLISITLTLSGVAVGAAGMRRIMKKRVSEIQYKSNKFCTLFLMMNQWVKIKQEGKNVSDYFAKKGYKRIAIYGMGYVGETLLAELKDSNIEIVYGIDKNAYEILTNIKILTLEDSLPDVDVIVVTAVTYFDEIQESLSKNTNIKNVSLYDILYEI